MVLEHVEQQLLLRVDDDADAAAREARHDALVDIVRQGLRDGAREHERVARAEAVEPQAPATIATARKSAGAETPLPS